MRVPSKILTRLIQSNRGSLSKSGISPQYSNPTHQRRAFNKEFKGSEEKGWSKSKNTIWMKKALGITLSSLIITWIIKENFLFDQIKSSGVLNLQAEEQQNETVEKKGFEKQGDYAQFFGNSKKKTVIVLGTGWAAVNFVSKIDTSKYDVLIISPRNYFLFTPLLPSTTVGSIEPRSIVEPIRRYINRTNKAVKYVEASCTDVNFSDKAIVCEDVSECKLDGYESFKVKYDHLVVAVGSITNTFNTKGVEENCCFLKDVDDANKFRRKLIDILESAYYPSLSREERRKALNFLFVGGGPTGVEAIAELHDFLKDDLSKIYKDIFEDVTLTLIQSGDHILNTYDIAISEYAEKEFKRSKINVLINTRVLEVQRDGAILYNKQTKETEKLNARLVLWSTGIKPSPLVQTIQTKLDSQYRHKTGLLCDKYLRLCGVEKNSVFAIGDCSSIEQTFLKNKLKQLFHDSDTNSDGVLSYDEFSAMLNKYCNEYPQLKLYQKKIGKSFEKVDTDRNGTISFDEFTNFIEEADKSLKPLPATAQVARQEGDYLAKYINRIDKDSNESNYEPFRYNHFANLAYIGKERAVADLGVDEKTVFKGFITFLLWRSVYWTKQMSWKNRFLVSGDWAKSIVFGRDTSRF